jgi:Type VI secretion, TssG
MSEATQPAIPDFTTGTHGFRHNVDSALDSLDALGIPPDRITIRMSGGGQSGHIVDLNAVGMWSEAPSARGIVRSLSIGNTRQLAPDENVILTVQGPGFFHALPMGMWDRGSDGDPGTQEMVEPFDDPLQKAGHWLRAGARLFDIRREDTVACKRWIRLFGLDGEGWPSETLYPLALLLPSLSKLAGTATGIRYALRLMLDLPLFEIRRKPAFSKMEETEAKERTLLGERSSRLGVDTIVGDRLEDLAELVFVLGPVTLDTYYRFQGPANRSVLSNVFSLCVTCTRAYTWTWLVLDPKHAPRLGHERQNARLGINSHMGGDKPLVEPARWSSKDEEDGSGPREPTQEVMIGESQ